MAYQRPAKLLKISLGSVTVAASYSGADPWNGNAIRWNAVLTVTSQTHSDPASTPTQYTYNGNNVAVGDYITTTGTGKTLKVYSISAQNASTVTCVLEDVNRANTFQDDTQNGDGGIPSGNGYLYEVVNGYPVLYPLPDALFGTLPPSFATQVIARFLSLQSAGGSGAYTGSFNSTTDWGTAAGGLYSITIPAGTHGKGIPTTVQLYEDTGTEYVMVDSDTLKINKSTGAVIISVSDTPNGRFAGIVTIR